MTTEVVRDVTYSAQYQMSSRMDVSLRRGSMDDLRHFPLAPCDQRAFGKNDSVLGPRGGTFKPSDEPLHDKFDRDCPRDVITSTCDRDCPRDVITSTCDLHLHHDLAPRLFFSQTYSLKVPLRVLVESTSWVVRCGHFQFECFYFGRKYCKETESDERFVQKLSCPHNSLCI